MIILLLILVVSFCVFFSLLAFSPLSLCPFPVFCFVFRCCLFSFSFFSSFSSFLLLFLGLSFVCFVLSSFFGFFFSSLFSSTPSSLLPHPPFRSRFGFFFSLLWPLFLGFFLGFLFPFSSSCLSFSSSFVLSPLLLSSPFLSLYSLLPFKLAMLPSRLSSLPLWWVPLLPLCLLSLWLSFSLSLRFWVVWSSLCFSCWCFRSQGSPFVPVSLSSLLISRRLLLVPLLLLLSSSRLFLIFPLLCLFFLLFFYLVPSCRLCCCASLSGSFFLGFALLRSFLCPQPPSLRLRWGGGGGTRWLRRSDCYLDNRRWSLLLIRGFLHGFSSLFSVPPAIASGSSSLPPTASLLAPPSSSLGLRL